MTIDKTHIDALIKIAGDKGYTIDPKSIKPHTEEPRGKFFGKTLLVLYPDSTEMVSDLVKYCYQHNIKIVPQGGITGLVGGTIPDQSGNEVVISLKRMNKVREKDLLNNTMTLESGVILSDAHDIAASMNAIMPMHIASEGSAMIGGNISSNAGGINVLRYGNMREFVLGLEVVLPNGDIWNGLTGLRKDNTGYDLKQLFIGAEGTLGIITAATLKIYPDHKQKNTSFVAIPDPDAAVTLLSLAREVSGDSLIAFEILPRIGLDFTIEHMSGCREPLEAKYDWYMIMECATSLSSDLLDLETVMERILETAMEQGLVLDGVVPKNEKEARELWNLREFMSEAQKFEGGSIKHDVAVPVSKIPEFLEKGTELVKAEIPGIRPVPFGHIGDGNIHFNLSQPTDMEKSEYLAKWEDINHKVHELVVSLGGSISAEHGIGTLKADELAHFKPDVDLNTMKSIKDALDPKNIMNPGRILKV
ncbi:FAD-binding oxidoreductase [Pseudemcibacter aquimaris]|uniref:FAD-binding oxidoreductase n=1 Tax=Pseudemcibacter aquimaris TaxID=2857064 RepID=UPI0020118B5A|nr:FAD-binding oxidoreductase [Pseudemcibacter aquimaris]MCC3861323.1 FAD-binding oxidoreductase [Pseudemcibacter aquimaris]WDU58095.1 FAD-binding oxidoreductase [Pseudemcibacter aquimaris]